MADRLERFINLIAKTGDKLVVYDRHQPENSFVISSLGDYERLLIEAQGVKGLTEDELIDKINRDIALWKSGQVSSSEMNEEAPEPEEYMVSPRPESSFEKKPRGNAWKIPPSRRREEPIN